MIFFHGMHPQALKSLGLKHLVIYLLLVSQTASAQFRMQVPSPHPFYTASSDSMLIAVPGMREGSRHSIGLYSEQKFGLKEIALFRLDSYWPHHNSAFSFSASTFGNIHLRLSGLSLGYARVFKDVRAILDFNLLSARAANRSNSDKSVSCRFSLLWRPPSPWWVAFDWDHFVAMLPGNQPPASSMQLFLGYRFSDQVSTTVACHNTGRTFVSLLYLPVERVVLKAGIASMPVTVSGMIGFRFSNILLQLLNNYHPLLGNSPALAVSTNW